LLVPVWLSNAEDNPHHPNWLATIYSDDGGGTWKAGAIALRSGGEVVNPNETVAVELANGQVMLNVRSMSARHRRIVITSPDGAGRWSAARFQEELLEPICFGSLVRYGKTSARGPNRLLFVNPDTLERRDGKAVAGQSRDRRNLTVQLSEDDGQSWKRKRVLEAGWSAYADIAVGRDNVIHVLYERGAPDPSRMRTAALTLASFPLRWLLTKDNSQE
jgi:sialidase-1